MLQLATLVLGDQHSNPSGRAIDEAHAPHVRFQLHYDSVLAKVGPQTHRFVLTGGSGKMVASSFYRLFGLMNPGKK